MKSTDDQFDCQYKRFLFVLKMATLEAWLHAKRLWFEHDASAGAIEEKYSPDQPRVPAGNPDGGQWTDGDYGVPTPKPRPAQTRDDITGSNPDNSVEARINRALHHLRTRAETSSKGYCAQYVREALNAGGFPLSAPPKPIDPWAKFYGSQLEKIGFRPVISVLSPLNWLGYEPISHRLQAGDVVIIQDIPGHKHGHMAMYDGERWISDWPQRGFWPWRTRPSTPENYIIYRYQ